MLKKRNGKLNKKDFLIENCECLFRLYREALKQAVSFIQIHIIIQLMCFISQAVDPKTGRVDVAILTTGISAGERRLRADLAQNLKRFLKERKSTRSTEAIKKDTLFNEMRERNDERITRDMFDDAIRALEEENFLVATNHTVRIVTLGESNFD